jgi:hypothetical protein
MSGPVEASSTMGCTLSFKALGGPVHVGAHVDPQGSSFASAVVARAPDLGKEDRRLLPRGRREVSVELLDQAAGLPGATRSVGLGSVAATRQPAFSACVTRGRWASSRLCTLFRPPLEDGGGLTLSG